jgi:exosortase/archaeosortase family protein
MGFSAVAEGTTIVMDDVAIGVVEACSGLGMLVTFVAMAAAVAILVKRPWLDRVLLVLSSLPIALAANVVRITATGVLGQTLGAKWADLVFHDLAGWLMMPLALLLLGLEVWLLNRLLVLPAPEAPLTFDVGGPMAVPPPAKKRTAQPHHV